MPRVGILPGVPNHQEVKWTKLQRRFYQAQAGVSFHQVLHPARQGEHQLGAGKTAKGNTEIGNPHGRTALLSKSPDLLIRNCLDARKRADDEVLRVQILV